MGSVLDSISEAPTALPVIIDQQRQYRRQRAWLLEGFNSLESKIGSHSALTTAGGDQQTFQDSPQGTKSEDGVHIATATTIEATNPAGGETTEITANDDETDVTKSITNSTSPIWDSYQNLWISIIVVNGLIIVLTIVFWMYLKRKCNTSTASDGDGGAGGVEETANLAPVAIGLTDEDETARLTGRTTLSKPPLRLSLAPKTSSNAEGGNNSSEVVGEISKETQHAVSENTFGASSSSWTVFLFFCWICLTQFARSFEGGFTAALMSNIQDDLGIDYTKQGSIAASPDYGLCPGAILAIWTYRHIRAKIVLSTALIGIGLSSIVVSIVPEYATLVSVRTINGVLYAHAAVFFPIWIDRHGPTQKSRTVWMSWMNSSLLLGLLFGYFIGGLVRNKGDDARVTWVELYFVNGCIMGFVGLLIIFGFDQTVVRNDGPYRPSSLKHADSQQVDYGDYNRNDENDDSSTNREKQTSVWELLCSLLHSFPYVMSVLIVGCLVGGVTFAFYFVGQFLEEKGYDSSTITTFALVIFIAAPVPGTLMGSYVLGHWGGGYMNHLASFGMALISAVFILAASIIMPFTDEVNSDGSIDNSTIGNTSLLLFSNWLWFFAGSMPATPLYGVGVSVLPRASLVASALQFAIVNLAKVFVPQLGGIVCDRVGLLQGYYSTLMTTSLTLLVLAWISVLYIVQRDTKTNTGIR